MTPQQQAFVSFCRDKVSRPVLWGAKGAAAYENIRVNEVYDCSGLVTSAIYSATGVDLRFTHNAQRLSDETVVSKTKKPGDLAFYGKDWAHIIHVAVWLAEDEVVSASGATSSVKTIVDAIVGRASVRIERLRRRGDLVGVKTNKWITQE